MKILFVCTGNTCRSPMASAMMAQLFPAFEICSAGLMAAQNAPATAHAIAVMKEREIDLDGHRSQVVNIALLKQVDLVLTMTQGHKEAMLRSFPGFEIYTLGEYCETADISIADPYGGNVEDYRNCANEIYSLITKIDKFRND